MQKHKIVNWFFLDLSMPYFIKYARAAKANQIDGFGPDNLATRFSEFEPIEYALSFKGMANWLWVDYFTKYPVSDSKLSLLTTHFKLCLVSPELQGHTESTVESLKKYAISAYFCSVRSIQAFGNKNSYFDLSQNLNVEILSHLRSHFPR